MDWTQTFVILAAFGGGFLYLANRIGGLAERLNGIDQRLSRLEGRFEERGYWESRKTGTEEKK